MYCFNCGKQISEEVKFCPYCGKEQKAVITPSVIRVPETDEVDTPAAAINPEKVVANVPVEILSASTPKKTGKIDISWISILLFLAPPLVLIKFIAFKGTPDDPTPFGQSLLASAVLFSLWGVIMLLAMGVYWLFKRKWKPDLFWCILAVNILFWGASFLYDYLFLTVRDFDHNRYHIVQIGRQYWMAENLRVTHYNDGSNITEAQDSVTWTDTDGLPKWCNSPGKNSGHLYNWYAVDDIRKICPAGWHVATDKDWQQLIDNAGGKEEAGNLLKYTENYTGFGAVGDCYRGCHGYYYIGQEFIGYWTSTVYNAKSAWMQYFFKGNNGVTRAAGLNGNGFYVRCVRD